jgi:hypothetical protein
MTMGPIVFVNTSAMTRQFFRQSLLPPFRSAALRIHGCTFSLKPLSGTGPV